MQSAESQSKTIFQPSQPDRVGVSSVHEVGCVSKKWLFFKLRPYRKTYSPGALRVFFTEERLERCNIAPEDYPRIRIFSPEATHVIISDLQKFGFL